MYGRTMYDLGSERALRGDAEREALGCAYVRCTTRTTAVSAYGQRGCAAPEGRTGRVVPVSQFGK